LTFKDLSEEVRLRKDKAEENGREVQCTNISKKVQCSYSLKIRRYVDLLWSLYSGGAALAFMFIVIGLMTTPYQQAHAQTSPLTEDQDGNGDPLNEESDLKTDCSFDQTSPMLGVLELSEKWATTLSEEDCNFAMHYLSGQCEEQTAKGVNVTGVCDTALSDYLSVKNLYTKDFPTYTERFNTILDEFKQKRTSEKQEAAQTEANKPSWAENLE
jgi:hypothetical protein